MKKLLAVIVLCLLPVVALAQDGPMTIIGGAVGCVVEGPNLRSNVSGAFGGLRIAKISENANLFGALQMQNIAEPNINGWGGRILLQNKVKMCPDLSVIMDVGWLSNVAKQSNGTRKTGLKVGGGLGYQLGDIIGVFVYGDAFDSGPNFSWAIYTGLYGINLHSLIPGL